MENNYNEYKLLYDRVNDLEAQVNKMEATCKLQHPVNLSERSTICEMTVKSVKETFEKFENATDVELNKLKKDVDKIHDDITEDIDVKIEKFEQRIGNNEKNLHEIEGKINAINMALTDITVNKTKAKDTLSSLWVTIVGTVISSIIVALIAYFFTVHNVYQQQNHINNIGGRQLQVKATEK